MGDEKKDAAAAAAATPTPTSEESLTKALEVLTEINKSGITSEDVVRLSKAKAKAKGKGGKKSSSSEASESSEEEKSLFADLSEEEVVKSGFEVSDFLETVTEKLTDAIDGLNKSMIDGQAHQGKVNDALAKSMVAVGDVLKEMSKRMEVIEKTPMGLKKSATSTGEARHMGAGPEEKGGTKVKKSEITNFLMAQFEADKGTGLVKALDITNFEQLSRMRPEVRSVVDKHFNLSKAEA